MKYFSYKGGVEYVMHCHVVLNHHVIFNCGISICIFTTMVSVKVCSCLVLFSSMINNVLYMV